jgi:hypothetical protein
MPGAALFSAASAAGVFTLTFLAVPALELMTPEVDCGLRPRAAARLLRGAR